MLHPAYACKKEKEPGLGAKACLGRWMHRVSKDEFGGETPDKLWDGMVNWIGKTKQWLVDLYHGLAEAERKRKAAGMGYGYGKPQVAWGIHGASVNQVKRGKGTRAWGAGAKRWLKPIWLGVKEWFNHER